jgi:signal transduction histidine kinase
VTSLRENRLMFDFLKKVPLFAELPDEDLERLCDSLVRLELKAGTELFAEGDDGDAAYLIEQGKLEILKSSGNRQILLAVRGAGEVIGEVALLEQKPRIASVRAQTDVTLIEIKQEEFRKLLRTSPSAAEAMYYSMLKRYQNTHGMLRQSERMAQLGTFTAGIAHELNNPAAAVRRSAEQLREAMMKREEADLALQAANLNGDQQDMRLQLAALAMERSKMPPQLGALARSDKEYELETWLERQGVADPWELASSLADLDLPREKLDDLAGSFEPAQLSALFHWLIATYGIHSLFHELQQGAERISDIVKALKNHAYLDQAPIQEVDIHRGLDNTLIILNHKLKTGPEVRRDYAEELPRVLAYGSELNQVWTNIIDNAIDILEEHKPGEGIITIRTRKANDDWVVVEIEDNGPGIPDHVLPRLFEPFFTTKPPGVGTGLGLDITYNIVVHRHRGDIRVTSEPGSTVFQVWLPVDFENCVVSPGQENLEGSDIGHFGVANL